MIEIMVSLVLVGIAVAFVFSIQVRMSSALRDQQTVSEVQQTLRSASELILRDVRMSGYLAQKVGANISISAPTGWIGPVTVTSGGVDGAPDTLTLVYADTSTIATVNSNTATVPNTGTAYSSTTGTFVNTTAGFSVGEPVLLTHFGASTVGSPPAGTTILGAACILAVTGTSLAPSPAIKTDPSGGTPYNTAGNAHCDPIFIGGTLFNDGLTEFTKLNIHKYRIRPGDTRGVLEVSPSGELVANDYQPLALGIVDMQIALRVALTADAPPCATDGDNRHDWYSSTNMTAIPANAKIVQVSITLLAKTTKEVTGVATTQTPDLFDGDAFHRACNHTGDVAGKPLPNTDNTSMYYGDHVYRTYTATVDLRNANTTN